MCLFVFRYIYLNLGGEFGGKNTGEKRRGGSRGEIWGGKKPWGGKFWGEKKRGGKKKGGKIGGEFLGGNSGGEKRRGGKKTFSDFEYLGPQMFSISGHIESSLEQNRSANLGRF